MAKITAVWDFLKQNNENKIIGDGPRGQTKIKQRGLVDSHCKCTTFSIKKDLVRCLIV